MNLEKFWGCNKKLKKIIKNYEKNEDNFDVFVDKNIDKIKNNKQFNKKSNEWSF